MKKVLKTYAPTLVLILCLYFILFNLITTKPKLLIIFITSSIMIVLIKTLCEMITTFNEQSEFKKELCNYVRTYGFILTKVDNIPNINSFNIFKVKSFDKILEKAMEDRVNMIYVQDDHTCDFLFTSGGNLYIYTIKESEKYYSRVDKYFIQQQTVLK
ncbi:MAG: hypothetical protein IJS56_04050 [Bacilli bacterium]|nr:hypothetical protein [Bacilli bacterium]